MASVAGSYHSVPDATRKRVLKVQNHLHELRISENGHLVAQHPVQEGKKQRRVDPSHRKGPPLKAKPAPLPGIARPSLDYTGLLVNAWQHRGLSND